MCWYSKEWVGGLVELFPERDSICEGSFSEELSGVWPYYEDLLERRWVSSVLRGCIYFPLLVVLSSL